MKKYPSIQLDAALHIHLLLVDDEPDFIETIGKHCRRVKIETSTALGCEQAIEIMEQKRAQVLIMDISMPITDGITCLHRIKQRWPTSEVIMLTGHASVKSGIAGMEGGAFDYCLKPTNTQELLEKIELAAQKALLNDKTR